MGMSQESRSVMLLTAEIQLFAFTILDFLRSVLALAPFSCTIYVTFIFLDIIKYTIGRSV